MRKATKRVSPRKDNRYGLVGESKRRGVWAKAQALSLAAPKDDRCKPQTMKKRMLQKRTFIVFERTQVYRAKKSVEIAD